MPANSIGSTSLILSTQSDQLTAGLQQAGSQINNWSKTTAQQTQNHFAGLGKDIGNKLSTGINAATSGLGKGAFSGLGGALSSALGGLKSVVGGAGSALGGVLGLALKTGLGAALGPIGLVLTTALAAATAPLEKMNELLSLQRQAETIGMAASELQGMELLVKKVGLDAGQTVQMLEQMGRNITDINVHREISQGDKSGKIGGGAELSSAGRGAAAVLDKLGVSVQSLASLPLEEQFKQVADAINQIPRGAQQAAAAMAIFGDSGARLLPILQKGSSGISEFIAEAKKSGAILSDGDIAKAAEAAKQVKEAKETISRTWEAMINRITVAVAPIVSTLAKSLDAGFKVVQPFFDWVARGFETAADIISAFFDEVVSVAQQVGDWIKQAGASVGVAFEKLPTIQEAVSAGFRAIGYVGAVVWDSLKAGAGGLSIAFGYIVKGLASVWDSLMDVLKALDRLPSELKPDWLQGAINSLENLKIGKAGDGMIDWGKNAIKNWGNSLDQVDKWFDKIANKQKQNVVKNAQQAAEAVAAVFQPVQAALKGSKEEYDITTKFDFESKFGKQPQQNVQGQQLNEQKKANEKLDKLISAVEKITPVEFNVV